ncbi:MAG: magnesium chelatase subunit H [Maricaulaceae bacterium]
MLKPTLPSESEITEVTPVRVVMLTLDRHMSGEAEQAQTLLSQGAPGLEFVVHAATDWGEGGPALDACRAAIATGDIIIISMLFIEEQIQAVLPDLMARREACDAMVGILSAGEIVKLTKLGDLRMDAPQKGPLALLKRLRGSKSKSSKASGGAGQMALLRRLPKILKYIPGKAQDLRAYFLTMQYYLSGSQDNVVNLVRMLVDRYAAGPRADLKGKLTVEAPIVYPDVGLYHPRLPGLGVTEDANAVRALKPKAKATVGLILLRSYVLARDAGHYNGVIEALEARGLAVLPVFASGLDSRPAIQAYFTDKGRTVVDAVVSLTGFSLVGGPAYNDARAAEATLKALDVPYVSACPVEFQSLERWGASEQGLMPVESTIMVAIPELDGATNTTVYGGRSDGCGGPCPGCERKCVFPKEGNARAMRACPERAEAIADRISALVDLRAADRAHRKVAVVLFNFPPNGGGAGTAAFLSVYESLFNTLKSLKAEGYTVELPESAEALKTAILNGTAAQYGQDANVLVRIPTDDHVRREPYLEEIEAQWGPAPGRQLTDGRSIFVLGVQCGNVLIGLQPGFGYEGDPMRLLFESTFTPTHAFSAFYRYIREDFGADAVIHFGTHGALEFMPGKQSGVSGRCWPDRLIGDLPNLYLYAANNPSEGALAKRRSNATLISYLTPPVAHAGLYRELLDLKASIERWRGLSPEASLEDRQQLSELIQTQAAAIDLVAETPAWNGHAEPEIDALRDKLLEWEGALIPEGLHVFGQPPSEAARADLLSAMAEANYGLTLPLTAAQALVQGRSPQDALARVGLPPEAATIAALTQLKEVDAKLARDNETAALIHALDAGFTPPAPGGDLLRTPEVLPTGRNIHGFDPFRIPSAFAVKDGYAQAERLLERHRADHDGRHPETLAMVLWGADNLKSEGGPIGQALALMGAEPRLDSYGRLCGAQLIPLETLGRPRIDVIATLSGIFRDLLPLQTRMLAEAAYLAASAEDEPVEQNFVRKHALQRMAEQGVDLETAALRVFSNADGSYGANVNQMIDAGCWTEEDELADAYESRKSFAYGRKGPPQKQTELLKAELAHVDAAYQNLESVELGVTTIDHYFDTLGGVSRAVKRAKGEEAQVYIGDQTTSSGKVRTLNEQVALETRTRTLNPKWYEGMLKHGYEGVRQIEAQVTNTLGWSATTGKVDPWVYRDIARTFVLDEAMRERIAKLNPKASAKLANRLIEAHERAYWSPDAETLEALRQAGDALEDRLEGLAEEAAA